MNDDSTTRIVADVRAWVAASAPGVRVPSTRDLVLRHGASPVTVQRAMRQLVAEGLVESRPGVGTFVREPRAVAPVDYGWQTAALGTTPAGRLRISSTQRTVAPDTLALHSGYPTPDLLPERLVRTALARAARTSEAITRTPTAGLPDLRAWFAGELARLTPVGVPPATARDVVILPGSQSGISAILRAVVGHGRPLLIESPTYWGAIQAARQAGVVLVPVPSGSHGPDPEHVARALAETGARAFFAQPTYANPTGAQWRREQSQAILTAVRDHDAFLVEDDWAHDLAIDGHPHPIAAQDHGGHVIYLRSLTKSVSPALRVAAVVARGPARDRILADRAAESMYVSGLLQRAALDVVTQPGWRTHLRGLRHQLESRRDSLHRSLRDLVPELDLGPRPAGGLNLWGRLPDGVDPEAVSEECERRGLAVAPGHEWFPAEPTGGHLRLTFAGPEPERYAEAAGILAAALAAVDR